MGCDIHMFVEYRPRGYSDRWRSYGGEIRGERWYKMFAKLAGVRGDESDAIIQPRGFPDDAGMAARDGNFLYVVEGEANNEGHVSRDKAEQWVREGSSTYISDRHTKGALDGELTTFDGEHQPWISHPDWHSHSWLTAQEYGSVVRAVAEPVEAPGYYATLAAMRQFEAAGYDSRVVFWFDN